MNVETIEHSEWWHHVEKGLFKPHEANVCVTYYGETYFEDAQVDLRFESTKKKRKQNQKQK